MLQGGNTNEQGRNSNSFEYWDWLVLEPSLVCAGFAFLKGETAAFEVRSMSVPCTKLSLFNYANVNTVFHSMALLTTGKKVENRTFADINIL